MQGPREEQVRAMESPNQGHSSWSSISSGTLVSGAEMGSEQDAPTPRLPRSTGARTPMFDLHQRPPAAKETRTGLPLCRSLLWPQGSVQPQIPCETPPHAKGAVSPLGPCVSCPAFTAFIPPSQPSPRPGHGTVGLAPASPGDGEPQLSLISTPSCPALSLPHQVRRDLVEPLRSKSGPAWPSWQSGTCPSTHLPPGSAHAGSPL